MIWLTHVNMYKKDVISVIKKGNDCKNVIKVIVVEQYKSREESVHK